MNTSKSKKEIWHTARGRQPFKNTSRHKIELVPSPSLEGSFPIKYLILLLRFSFTHSNLFSMEYVLDSPSLCLKKIAGYPDSSSDQIIKLR